MIRIGIVGSESTHVSDYLSLINGRAAVGEARVTALCPDDPRQVSALKLDDSVRVCSTSEQFFDCVDAVIVASRRASVHHEQAIPLLERGLPVFVDKPFTNDTGRGRDMMTAAQSSNALVTSYSAVRWVPSMGEFVHKLEGLGGLRAVVVAGGADPNSPWDGLWFYGIHMVEALLHVLAAAAQPLRIDDLTTRTGKTGRSASGRAADVEVAVHLVTPGRGSPLPFSVYAVGELAVVSQTITIGRDYLLPGLKKFIDMVRTGRAPLDDEQLLAPVRLLSAIVAG